MKTLEEKAREYAGITPEICDVRGLKDFPGEQNTLNKYYNFIAGYKSAFEWISTKNELPPVKSEPYYVAVKSPKKTEKGIVEEPGLWQITSDEQIDYLAHYCTHWRYFNLEDIE